MVSFLLDVRMSDPANSIMERVREAVAGSYDLLGALGTDEHGEQLFLARELSTGSLVGLAVNQEDADGTEFSVEPRRTLGQTITVKGSVCPECKTELPDLERFCFQCGADLSGVVAPEGSPEATRALNALASAIAGRFEILGRMDREGRTGMLYFARELATQRIVALRLRRADASDAVSAEFVASQTKVFRPPTIPTRAPKVDTGALGNAAPGGATVPARGEAIGSVPNTATFVESTIDEASPMDSDAHAGGFERRDVSADEANRIGAKPAWFRSPAVIAGAVVVLAGIGYVALRKPSATRAPDTAGMAATSAPAPDSASASSQASATTTPAAPATSAPTPSPATTTSTTTSPAPTGATSTDSGSVRITSSLPPGALVTVDGKVARGKVIRVAPGTHQLIVVATGYTTAKKDLKVAPGATVQWAPAMTALASATATEPAKSEPKPVAKVAPKSACKTSLKQEHWAEAVNACRIEAEEGDATAAANLGRLFTNGLGTGRDANQAFTWYQKAAQAGNRDAQTALGYAYRAGSGVKRDKAESAKLFRQAADAGDATAQLEYAIALENGDGIDKDERGARDWYQKSALQGTFMAARRLGKMCERGAGGPKSEADAAAAYEHAATLGDAESAFKMGKWYKDGKGVAKSNEKALQWFKRALELGNTDANDEIKKLEKGF
jgi:TPR repeat protein